MSILIDIQVDEYQVQLGVPQLFCLHDLAYVRQAALMASMWWWLVPQQPPST